MREAPFTASAGLNDGGGPVSAVRIGQGGSGQNDRTSGVSGRARRRGGGKQVIGQCDAAWCLRATLADVLTLAQAGGVAADDAIKLLSVFDMNAMIGVRGMNMAKGAFN